MDSGKLKRSFNDNAHKRIRRLDPIITLSFASLSLHDTANTWAKPRVRVFGQTILPRVAHSDAIDNGAHAHCCTQHATVRAPQPRSLFLNSWY